MLRFKWGFPEKRNNADCIHEYKQAEIGAKKNGILRQRVPAIFKASEIPRNEAYIEVRRSDEG